jgi:uncharacterized Zn-binding protein involved in type VI secretion
MGQPAAKQGDQITAMDTHQVGNVPTPMPFNGILQTGLSTNVNIMGLPAATVGSGAVNTPPHAPPVVASNTGTVLTGSGSVFINGKRAARSGDTAQTCNESGPLPIGQVVASGTVNIG